jgi:hypothetical protein
MNLPDFGFDALRASAAFVAGLALGIVFFGTLWRNMRFYAEGRVLAGALLHASRFLLAIAILAGAVQFGAMPLLACAFGLVVGRMLVMRFVERKP